MLPYLFIYFTNLSFSANCFITFFFYFFGELGLYYCIQAFSNCDKWGYSSLLWEDLPCCKAWVLEHAGFSRCSTHVGSSQTRVRTCVLCTSRQILHHWTTGKSISPLFQCTLGLLSCQASLGLLTELWSYA